VADQGTPATLVRAPHGIFQARVDDKGRLKLPSALREYVLRFGEKSVFITSLDHLIARIYPNVIWENNQRLLDEFTEDPEAAADVAFTANDLGADSEMDDQGRVLIPQELRRLLEIENQPVWLEVYQGGINIYGKAIYDERKKRAQEGRAEKLRLMRQKGFK
jgi:MraZ protein